MTNPKLCCPFCREFESKVVNSRPVADYAYIRRRRECLTCGERFYTQERVIKTKQSEPNSTTYHI